MPKVSIVCPVHNTEKFLDQTISSFINQTLKDIEIFLINDDSTDNSLVILNKYATYDKRIQVYSRKHAPNETWGYTNAINIGRAHATGDYIIFPDSDDYFELDALEKLYLASDCGQADIVKGSMQIIESNGTITTLPHIIPTKPIYNWVLLNENDNFLHFCPQCPELQTMLIKRTLQKDINFCKAVYMDSGTVFKLKVLSRDFRYIPDVVYTAIAHDASTGRNGKVYDLAPFEVFDDLECFLKQNQIHPSIWPYFNAYKFYQIAIGFDPKLEPCIKKKYLDWFQRDLKKEPFNLNYMNDYYQNYYNYITQLVLD